MSLFGQPGNIRRRVAESEVKLCALCGALNYHRNGECFTCGWRGAFECDSATIHLAWQRLYDEFRGVYIEHITAARASSHAVFPRAATPSPAAWLRQIGDWWNGLVARRAERLSQGDRRVRSQAFPPNELGV